MNIARIASLSFSILLAVVMAGCSSSEGDDKGSSSGGTSSGGTSSGGTTSGGTTSGGTSSGGTTSSSGSSSSCSSAALNGRCLEGPKKGSSCCMPDEDTGKTCSSGTDCDTVCEYCK